MKHSLLITLLVFTQYSNTAQENPCLEGLKQFCSDQLEKSKHNPLPNKLGFIIGNLSTYCNTLVPTGHEELCNGIEEEQISENFSALWTIAAAAYATEKLAPQNLKYIPRGVKNFCIGASGGVFTGLHPASKIVGSAISVGHGVSIVHEARNNRQNT